MNGAVLPTSADLGSRPRCVIVLSVMLVPRRQILPCFPVPITLSYLSRQMWKGTARYQHMVMTPYKINQYLKYI